MKNDVFFEIMEKYALFFNCNIHTLNLCDYSIYFIAVNTLGGNFFLICRNWPDDLLSFARRGELSRDWRGVSPLHTPPGVSALVQTSSSKILFQDARGGTFRIVIAYEESIIAIFEDIGQSKLSQDVDRR